MLLFLIIFIIIIIERDLIKTRTEVAEKWYKMFKNRLTNILRQVKKQYFDKMLQINIKNIKCTRNILNNIMANESRSPDQSIS